MAFYCILGRTSHHVYCNVNPNAIQKYFPLRSVWKKRKSFLNCSNNPKKNLVLRQLECLNHVIDEHSKAYDNFILIGDFNVGIDENFMKNVCDLNCLKTLIKIPICFKNINKPTCIDLILTIWPNLFQHSSAFKTQLWDVHPLTVTEFKMEFQELKPKIIAYHGCKKFDNAKFRCDIVTATSNVDNFGKYKSTIFNIFNMSLWKKSTFVLVKLPSCQKSSTKPS